MNYDKAYILFCWSQSFGGGQNYVNSKVKYLEENVWHVVVFSIREFKDNRIVWNNLKKYSENIKSELGYLPEFFGEKRADKIVDWMISRIPKGIKNIIIESCTDVTAEWGERLAQKLNAKHWCFLLDERLEEYDSKEFLYYKFKRGEVAGIHNDAMKKLFCYENVEDFNKYVLVAANGGSVQDISSNVFDEIPKADWNIAYLGRDKAYVRNIVNGVYTFAKNHSQSNINFIIMGNINSANNIEVPENINLINIGFLNPIPRKFFNIVDVVIAGAGCATLSAREKCMTIVADARTFLSDGVLGITASNSLFAMGKGENYEDTLEKVLVKHLYYRENINVKPIEDVGIFFEKHFEFIDNSSNKKQYFDFKKNKQQIALKKKLSYLRRYIGELYGKY